MNDEQEAAALRFVNGCLCDARQLHLLVTSSLRPDETPAQSDLLREDVQDYLRALLNYYYGSKANGAQRRQKLSSANALYYLQCLTDPAIREDFIRLAACPTFVSAAL